MNKRKSLTKIFLSLCCVIMLFAGAMFVMPQKTQVVYAAVGDTKCSEDISVTLCKLTKNLALSDITATGSSANVSGFTVDVAGMYYAAKSGDKPKAAASIGEKGIYNFVLFIHKDGYYFEHTGVNASSGLKCYSGNVTVTDAESNNYTTDYVDARSYYDISAKTNTSVAENNISLMVTCYVELDPADSSQQGGTVPSTGIYFDNSVAIISGGVMLASFGIFVTLLANRKKFIRK